VDEDDIGGATSPVTGLIRCFHRHRTDRAAPAPNTPDPLEIRQPPTDFAAPYTPPFRATTPIPAPGPPALARKAH